jgi:hypothetical protein
MTVWLGILSSLFRLAYILNIQKLSALMRVYSAAFPQFSDIVSIGADIGDGGARDYLTRHQQG